MCMRVLEVLTVGVILLAAALDQFAAAGLGLLLLAGEAGCATPSGRHAAARGPAGGEAADGQTARPGSGTVEALGL